MVIIKMAIIAAKTVAKLMEFEAIKRFKVMKNVMMGIRKLAIIALMTVAL